MANKILAFAQTTIKSIKDAKSLDLTASRQAIAFDKDNNAKDSTAVTLTATQQNFTDSITWSTSPNVTLSGTGNTRTLAISNFTNNNQIKVTITAGGLSDSVTIAKIKDGTNGTNGTNGQDAYTVILSNESQAISTDVSLKPLSAATYSCNVTVYKGTTKLTATNSTPGTNQFKVTLPSNPTGITLAQSTAGVVTFATTTSTAISANTNINLTIQINGVSETITKTISLSASKQGNTGATGSTGPTGSSATAYWLISSASAIGKNTSNVFNPTSVTFTLKSQTGTNAVANYSGRLIIAESTDGTNFTNKYTSSANEASKTYSPSSTNVKSIRVRMYQAGGVSVLLDEQIIPIVVDGTNGTNGTNGASAVTAVLSNDSHNIPCNTSGAATTFAGAVTTMSVFVGASDTSSSWTYSVSTTNVGGSASNNNRTYTVSSISADVGYVDITATRSGYSSITKRFTLTKSKQGNTGATGPTGPQGPQGEALGIYDGTFTEGKKFWSTQYPSYTAPGTSVEARSANTSIYGGKTLKITSEQWLYSKNPIAIEEGRVYKFIYRVRQLQNPSDSTKNKIYGGATEFSHNGTKLSTNNGSYFITSGTALAVKWKSVNNDSAPATYDSSKDDQYLWTEYVVYKSTSAKSAITYTSLTGTVTKFPAVSAFTANTKYIKPMFIVNYQGGNGIAEVDSLIVKDVTAEWEAAKESASKLNNDSVEIFNKVTDEGKKQGLFTGEDGNVYFNGQYINAKNLTVKDINNVLTLGVDQYGNVTINATNLQIGTKPVASKEYIDTMQVGGRNLIPNTGFINGTLNWKVLNSSTNLQIVDGRSYESSKAIQVDLTSNTGQGAWTPFGACIPNTKYISSCWVKVSKNAKVGQYIKYKNNLEDSSSTNGPSPVWIDAKANTWTYITQEFTTSDQANFVATTPRVQENLGSGTFAITEVKIEEGTKATAWSPAPEDLEDNKVSVGGAAADINTSNEKVDYARLNIKGAISFDDLDGGLGSNFSAKTDPVTGQIIQTLINGAKIETGTLTGDQINTRGFTAKDTSGNTTFDIDKETGAVSVRGTIESNNYSSDKGSEAGYKLTPEGDAFFNNAILRGSVILPSAGITQDATTGVDNANQNVRFWAGSEYDRRHEAPFRVLQDGSVVATKGDFGGTITGKLSIGNIHIEDTNDTQGFIQIRDQNDANILVHLEEQHSFINSELSLGTMLSFSPSKRLMEGEAIIKLSRDKYELTLHDGNNMLKSSNSTGIHRQAYLNNGGYLFESSGSNTAADYVFRRKDHSEENITVNIMGELYIRDQITSKSNIDIIVKTDSNNSGYDFVVRK